ncbi:MAG: hypothetical protein RIR00_249 [Pseudomonadota bacterium]|jgi:KDO2-lipid IV(A) lauroyltransferase
MGSRLLVAFLWVLHWLPLPLLRGLGVLVGLLFMALGRERRRVGATNLALCFPELSPAERQRLLRRHFVMLGQSLMDRPLFWWASRARLEKLIRVRNPERLAPVEGRPLILLCPHFVGLDAAGCAVTMAMPVVSVYSRQKNPVFDAVIYTGRQRFNASVLLSRQDGMRKVIKSLHQGYPFFYLPDMDFGPRDSLFVPFFGVPAATITGLSRLARATGARIVPCVARMTAKGYDVHLQQEWENYPGDSVEADTLSMNQFIETQVRSMPEQYFWLHKRFKTRPPGEQRYYP